MKRVLSPLPAIAAAWAVALGLGVLWIVALFKFLRTLLRRQVPFDRALA